MPVGAHVPLRLSLDAFTGTARQSAQAIILHVYRDFLNVEIGMTEARKAQVLGLDDLDRPQGTQRLLVRGAFGNVRSGNAADQAMDEAFAAALYLLGPPELLDVGTHQGAPAQRGGHRVRIGCPVELA